jgi:hypothetical protein
MASALSDTDTATGVSSDFAQGSSAATSHENSPPSLTKEDDQFVLVEPAQRVYNKLQELWSESRAGKIWRTAAHLIPQNVGIRPFLISGRVKS